MLSSVRVRSELRVGDDLTASPVDEAKRGFDVSSDRDPKIEAFIRLMDDFMYEDKQNIRTPADRGAER
ncbi:MAG: hypothetical protein MZW92_12355 [Comamonadaceae bacterium]|nr:hypothetical protein [Comamonadaceae bacterium]